MMIKPAQSMLKTKKGKLSRPVSKSGRQNNIPKVIKMKEEASAYGSLRELSSNLSGIYNKNQRIMDDSLQISTEDGGSQFRKQNTEFLLLEEEKNQKNTEELSDEEQENMNDQPIQNSHILAFNASEKMSNQSDINTQIMSIMNSMMKGNTNREQMLNSLDLFDKNKLDLLSKRISKQSKTVTQRSTSAQNMASDPYVQTSNDDKSGIFSFLNDGNNPDKIEERETNSEIDYQISTDHLISKSNQKSSTHTGERYFMTMSNPDSDVNRGQNDSRLNKMRNIKSEIGKIMTQIDTNNWKQEGGENANPDEFRHIQNVATNSKHLVESLTFSPDLMEDNQEVEKAIKISNSAGVNKKLANQFNS